MHNNLDELIPTRWSLLSRLKDWDDQDSWRQFFDAYWQLIYNTALQSGLNHSEAQEVVQETIISVAKKMPEFRAYPASGSFKHWLLKLTRWRILDQLRKRKREQPAHRHSSDDTARTSTVERIPEASESQIEALWEVEWEKSLLQTALDRVKTQVKPDLFQIFDLLTNKQSPARKVAARLKISLARVYYAQYRVAALVKKEIKWLQKHSL